jgi:hypothetical protein
MKIRAVPLHEWRNRFFFLDGALCAVSLVNQSQENTIFRNTQQANDLQPTGKL